MKNPVVTIEMMNGDIIKAELYPEVAPNTVNNFLSLVNKGFYNGLIFHRVIKGFMIQGGCPDGNGMGGPGYCIKGEFSHNGFQNDLAHTPGVLSMARAMNPNSAGSLFFILHEAAPYLNGFWTGDRGNGRGQYDRRGPHRLQRPSHEGAEDQIHYG